MEVRAVLITIFLFVLNSNAFSQVDSTFSGTISVDTTISGKLNVHSDIIINEGVTLTVEPGTILNVTGNFGITVNGAIHAVGTDTSKITIKSSSENPSAGDWKGIIFTSQSGFPASNLDYVIIKHAETGIYANSISNPYLINVKDSEILESSKYGIRFTNSNGQITNSIIQNYGSDGIFVEGSGSEVVIEDSEIDQQSSSLVRTGNGVFVHNLARVELIGNTIWRSNIGVYARNFTGNGNRPPTVLASGNEITQNKIGVYVSGREDNTTTVYPDIQFNGNDIYGNADWNINVYLGLDPTNTLLNFTNNWWGTTDAVEIAATIYDASHSSDRAFVDYLPMRNVSKSDSNGVSTSLNYKAGWITEETTWSSDNYVVSGRLVVRDGGSLEIGAGAELQFGPRSRLEVLNTLTVSGTEGNPVVAKGYGNSPTMGSWGGILLSGSGAEASSIDNLTVRDASVGLEVNGTGLNALTPIGLSGIEISDVSGNGLRFTNSRVTLTGASLQDVGSDGVSITDAEVNASGVSILNFGSDGIYVEGPNAEVVIEDSEIDQQSSSLVRTGNGVFVHNLARVELIGNTIWRSNIGVYARNFTGNGNRPPTVLASGNEITQNKIGVYVSGREDNTTTVYPDIQFNGNDIYGNADWNINVYLGLDPTNTLLNFTNNWWGTTDAVEIAATIYDASHSSDRAFVDYLPMRNVSKSDSNGVSTSLNYKAGWITEETTWSSDNYVVSGRLVVRDGGSLEIGAGAELQFGPRSRLEVLNTLTVSGTEGNPVVAKGYGNSPTMGSWGGILLSGSGAEASSIDNLTVRDASVGLEVNGTGLNALTPIGLSGIEISDVSGNGLRFTNSRVTLTGASLQDVGSDGVSITDAEVNASGVSILNFGSDGIYVEGPNAEVVIEDSEIDQQSSSLVRTGNGVFVHNNANVELNGNKIIRSNVGVHVRNNTSINSVQTNTPPSIIATGNILFSNRIGVNIDGRNKYTARSYPNTEFSGNDIYDNTESDVSLQVGDYGSTPFINFTNNWWGTIEKDEIESFIYDKNDGLNRAEVSFQPFLTETSKSKGRADINDDGRTDGFDLSILASSFGLSSGQNGFKANADIYGDSRIDGFDLAILGVHFGEYGRGGIMGKMNAKHDSVFVSLTSNKNLINKGDTLIYIFEVSDAPELYAFATTLKYDSRLKVIKIIESDFLSMENEFQTSFLRLDNNYEKELTIGVTRLNGEEGSFATGEGEILSISFIVQEEVSSDLELEIESIGLFSPAGLQYRVANNRLATSTEPINEIPENFSLHQNYPNPFNPTTNIQFEIPENSSVVLKVFDMLGREVATLVNDKMNAGVHIFTFDASSLSSGIYLYQIQAGEFSVAKKMILLK